MSDIARLFQQQVPLDSKVKVFLTNGKEAIGILDEISRGHVTLRNNGKPVTILLNMIGGWEVIEDTGSQTADSPIDESSDEISIVQDSFTKNAEESNTQQETPEMVDVFSEEDDTTSSEDDLNLKVYTKLIEINAHFQAYLQTPRIEITPPDLIFSAEEFQPTISQVDANKLWNRFVNKYNYAVKMNELSTTHGRLPNIISDLEELSRWYFVRLLLKFSNYYALKPLSEIVSARKIEQEFEIFINTIVFLLKAASKDDIAQEIIRRQLENHLYETSVSNALENFEKQPAEVYQKFLSELDFTSQVQIPSSPKETLDQHQGYVHAYKSKYGFLRDQGGQEYFFHSNAVVDAGLLPRLKNLLLGQKIPVTFQLAQGPKGDTIAVSVSAFRTVDEMFNLALRYAEEGEYHMAIGQIKKVLAIEPENPKAHTLYEKWREYARVTGVPKGSNPYARAKQVQLIEKDLERAEKLFRTAINQRDNWESAVKDLAMILDQLGRIEEAIELLKKYRGNVSDKQSVDNLLTSLYSKAEFYDQAITLLNEKLQQAKTSAKKIPLLWQIGNAYLRQEKYASAEQNFRQILRL